VTVTFNGEIYNDVELRQRLAREHGYVFSSTCDTEVIPAGYVAWGSSLFGMLEGMFAIALWDSRDRSLTLARDGAGIKPLFLSRSGTEVSFASEIKALLQNPRQGRAIDDGALHTFFAAGYAGPVATTLAGIEQVPPGTVRRINKSGTSDRRFWQPARAPDIFRLSDALDAFEPVWRAVTAEMLVSDVPVGVLQSGGIDSSLVTMAVRGRDPKPRLFTAGYAESTHDETELAGVVARLSGLPHEIVPMGEDAHPADTFAAVVYHTDGQLADSSAYSTYRLFAVMRRHLKVVLAGDGADEFFGGYPTYRASRVAGFAGPVAPTALAAMLGRFLADRGGTDERRLPAREVAARFLLGLSAGRTAHVEWRRLLPAHLMDRLYGPRLKPLATRIDPLADYRAALGRSSRGTLVDACLLADQSYYLPGDELAKVDATSMAHGLEVRVPFLDRRIMDLAGRVDASLLTPFMGRDKLMLRAALANMGVSSRVTRARKRGFNTPIAGLLRTSLAPLAADLLDERADHLFPYLDPAAVRSLWHEHRRGARNHAYLLWCVLVFAAWLDLLDSGYNKPN
jgi:asparagine synthase (glutamine-hydrolysing)